MSRAAQEYGLYEFAMVAVICTELVFIHVALFTIGGV